MLQELRQSKEVKNANFERLQKDRVLLCAPFPRKARIFLSCSGTEMLTVRNNFGELILGRNLQRSGFDCKGFRRSPGREVQSHGMS
jgi:hypothetical protein